MESNIYVISNQNLNLNVRVVEVLFFKVRENKRTSEWGRPGSCAITSKSCGDWKTVTLKQGAAAVMGCQLPDSQERGRQANSGPMEKKNQCQHIVKLRVNWFLNNLYVFHQKVAKKDKTAFVNPDLQRANTRTGPRTRGLRGAFLEIQVCPLCCMARDHSSQPRNGQGS